MKHWRLGVFVLVLSHLSLLILTQFTAWPEMLFWPYLIRKGWLPYRDIGVAHFPLLLYYLSAVYSVLGHQIMSLKIATWILVICSDLVFVRITKELLGKSKSTFAFLFFILFQIYYDGNGVWFDHLLALFPLLIYFSLQRKNDLAAGLFFGLAILSKQTAAYFLLPITLTLLLQKAKLNRYISVLKGFIMVISPLLVFIYFSGIFSSFYQWAIKFGVFILPRSVGQIDAGNVRQIVAALSPFAIVIPLSIMKDKKAISLVPWLIAGLMGVFPRFELFHFQPALPFLAIMYLRASEKITLPITLIFIFTIAIVGRGIAKDFHQEDRFNSSYDQEVFGFVDNQTHADDTVFVSGYWDNLYPLTNTVPAIRPFIPQLPWYLNQPGTADEVINDLIENQPRIIVVNKNEAPDPLNSLVREKYTQVQSFGEIDIFKLTLE